MSKKHKRPLLKLIANPGSGNPKEATSRLELATRSLVGHGFKVEVALAHPKEEATPIAAKAARDGYPLVVAMGGDGTIEAVLRGLVGTKTRLGILPAGSFNNIAKSLGIPEDLEAACALIANGEVHDLDIGRIKTKQGKFYFFEVAAIGLTAALYPKGKSITKGKWRNIGQVVSRLIHYEQPKVWLTLDDESQLEVNTLLVTIANTPAFGANFLVAPNASLEDGLLDVCVYPDFSKAQLIAHFAQVANAKPTDAGSVQRYRAKKVVVKAKPKLDVMADGVMQAKGKVKVKILPGALHVISAPLPGLAQVATPAEERLPAPVAPATAPAPQAAEARIAADKAAAQAEEGAPPVDSPADGHSKEKVMADAEA